MEELETLLLSVTPLVGVWIEMLVISPASFAIAVTPLVGVWIEIGMESIRLLKP